MLTGKYNYYEILEITSNSAQHEVTTAYERAKSTYSGDNPAIYTIFSENEARELLTLIEEAYAILGNKTLRSIYDQRLLGGKVQNLDLSYDSILNASKALFPETKTVEKKPQYEVNENFEKEIQDITQWDGSHLKKVREYKKISLERMSEKTKINPWYLTAIENNDSTNLPASVFVRGYVIQICKELGLKEKVVADSYMSLYKSKLAKSS